jgi:hypothetical protein
MKKASQATKVTIARPEPTHTPETIEVQDIETHTAPFVVRGLSPMLVNNFSEKSRQQLEDEATGMKIKTKRGSAGKAVRIPQEEYERARILDSKGRDCVPARWIKAALVTAAGMPDVDMPKNLVRQSVFVLGDLIPIESSDGPRMRGDMVRRGRFGAKVPMMAYRAEYPNWSIKFEVQFEPKLISHAKLIHLVRRAGLSIGLCEWRPEKNGEMGRFDVQMSHVK